ncbi:hypothetical protein LTR56_008147 [Elasticomyces elasticus]|nr:hypothetical protein LTR56_008147 [Elasticomyces elasticus]KAK3662899.1 hypothetical protein LTR22_006302 [Elasticomyces elasticus]
MVLLQIVAVAAVYVAYRVVWSYIENRRFEQFAEQHGCQKARDLTEGWLASFRKIRRMLNVKKSGEDFIDDIFALDFEDVSTVQRKGFEGSMMLTTIEPANLQAFLATQFDEFETGKQRYLQLAPILGRSIFTSDGAFWAHSRALFRPQFSRDNIDDLEATEKAAKALVTAVGPANSTGWTRNVDLSPMFFNFTLDTASEFLFGESAESQAAMMAAENGQNSGAVGGAQFRRDFELVGEQMISRIRLFSLYWMSDSFEFRRATGRVKAFTEKYVQAALNTTNAGKVEGKKETLLSRLATETRNAEELSTYPSSVVKRNGHAPSNVLTGNQTLAILFAGRDTTASLLGWSFWRLSLHPEIVEKLRSVILSDFPDDQPITFAALKDCRYLRHFINEVLRLHPTVPLNGRTAMKNTTLPVGGGADEKSPVAIRKGQAIGFSVYLMHRRKDLWGEDALDFRPERWEQKIPAWQFLPFLGGPRVCIGQQFALVEASYLIVRLLQRYDKIEPVDMALMKKGRKGLGL